MLSRPASQQNMSPPRLEPSQRAKALEEHQDFLTAEVLNTKGFHNTSHGNVEVFSWTEIKYVQIILLQIQWHV